MGTESNRRIRKNYWLAQPLELTRRLPYASALDTCPINIDTSVVQAFAFLGTYYFISVPDTI